MSIIKLMPPESLEPLSNWSLIGQGHFGDVFKVKHMEYRIPVAVKKLKENASYRLDELLDEARKIKYASENFFVIRLFGIVKAPPCIVMEWMEYGCLGALMERVKKIPWALKYRILQEVAIGMKWLHSLSPPLLHLDLKPKNVLLNDSLHIRITDFGLSKHTSSSTVPGEAEAIGGTLEYMPPEAFQEGYKPSMSTDVYSFAILSAVVLRGEDPYPAVQCSVLISIHVPQGQRPSFEFLENISSVGNLEKAIAFTKRCWDNDKQQRPNFDECCNQWEKFIAAYEDKEIKDAIKAVQNMMDCTDSSGSITDVQQSTSAPNTKEMSDMIKQMQTIHITEHPSAKQEAVPVRRNPGSSYVRGPVPYRTPGNQPRANVVYHGPSIPNYRTGPEPVRNSQIIQRQPIGSLRSNVEQVHQPRQALRGQSHLQHTGLYPRRNASVNMSGNVRTPQTVQRSYIWPGQVQAYPQMFLHPYSHMQYGPPGLMSLPHSYFSPQTPTAPSNHISLTNNMGPVQFGDNNEMFSGTARYPQNTFNNPTTQHPGSTGYTSFPPAASQTFNISISDNKGPLQIGDNNKMFVRESSQYRGLNTKPMTPQSGPTASASSFAPEQSTQPAHMSQMSLPTKEETKFSDAFQPTQETARESEQLLERPTTQDTTVSNALQGNDNITSSSSPKEEENSSKQ